MQHIFEVWPAISNKVSGTQHILLLSDYDGTLAPIVSDPQKAEIMPETLALLKELATQSKRYTVGVISGRALDDLKTKVSIEGLIYGGNHGLEIDGPDFQYLHPVDERATSKIQKLYDDLAFQLKDMNGVILENKALTISVHYRLVKGPSEKEVKNIVQRVLETPRASGLIKVGKGKKVIDIRPNLLWGKGNAVSFIASKYLSRNPRKRILTMFLGDDITDEDAFEAVRKLDGLSVRVGKILKSSKAEFYLRDVFEVQALLGRLASFKSTEASP